MSDTQILVRHNGPYRVQGPIKLVDDGGTEFEQPGVIALCRCGYSESKPFCDGRHKDCGFQAGTRANPVQHATDAPASASQLRNAHSARDVTILVRANGPYRVYGPAKLVDVDGNEFEIPPGEWFTLCRCGHSATKPFCDSTHKAVGFQPETRANPPL